MKGALNTLVFGLCAVVVPVAAIGLGATIAFRSAADPAAPELAVVSAVAAGEPAAEAPAAGAEALPQRELVRPWPLLQSLAEREPPPAIVPALDRSRLRVENARSADEELLDIAATLRWIFDRSHDSERDAEWHRGAPLTSRIVLFSWRYGSDPCEHPGWTVLEHTATTLLSEMGELAEDPGLSECVFRWQLLRLAGRPAEATAALKSYRGTGCGTCDFGAWSDIRRHQADAVAVDGDPSRGLRLLLEEFRDDMHAPDRRADDPALLTHTGLLLLQAGNSDGACLLQLVVDLHPTWEMTPLARAALEQIGALHEPSPDRIRRLYVDGLEEWDDRRSRAVWLMPELDDEG